MYKANINFFQSDVFTNCKNTYDLVISNPPYIPLTFAIDDYVKENEPKIALFDLMSMKAKTPIECVLLGFLNVCLW